MDVTKPNKAKSRFSGALDKAKGDNTPVAEKAAKTSVSSNVPTKRTNFDCPIDLRKDMDIFIKTKSHLFKSNREFFIQAIKDAMEKYKDA